MGIFATETVTGLQPVEFLRLFMASERIAIRKSVDPYVIDFRDMLDKATTVRLDHPDVISGVLYLEQIELLAPGRANEILVQ